MYYKMNLHRHLILVFVKVVCSGVFWMYHCIYGTMSYKWLFSWFFN